MSEPVPHRTKTDTLTPKFMVTMISGVAVAGLYFGRPVLLPLALAVLMSFALAPLVSLLKRLRLGHVVDAIKRCHQVDRIVGGHGSATRILK